MIETKNIKQIIGNYFEGKTSCKEEAILRSYFTTNSNIPSDLVIYQPLFTYFETENKKQTRKIKKSFFESPYFRIAAILFSVFFLGITGTLFFQNPVDNYVIINGKKITNKQTIMIYVEKSLANLSDQNSETEIFNSLNEFSTENTNPQLLFSIFSN